MADIAPNTPVQLEGGIALPGYFQPVTGGDLFLAAAGTGLPSIWKTDGTPEGTQPVLAGVSLGFGELIGSNGQRAFFAGSDGLGGHSVWATDGTSQGTALLQHGLGAPNEVGSSLAVVEGRLFFHDCAPRPSYNCDLWTSDGTLAGTEKLVELGGLARGLSGSASRFYFLAWDAENFSSWLWRTDGTAAGTIRLREFYNDGSSFDCTSIGGEALVAAEGKLWITSGDSVEPITTFSDSYVWFYYAAKAGDVLYFISYPFHPSTTLTIWRSDGTASGTSVVLSSTVLNSPVTPWPWVQQHGSRTYFLIPGPQGREPYTLWSSGADGEGAQPVACGGCASIPGPGWILSSGDDLYFPAAEGDVHTLWAIDSSHNARPLRTYCTGYCRTESAVAVEDGAMFPVDSGTDELWVTNGTEAGTQNVGSFRSLYNLYASTNLDAALFAASPEFPLASNLWISRGSQPTTVPLVPLEGEGSELRDLRRAGDRVAFAACREPSGLWGAGAEDAELAKEAAVNCSSGTSFYPFVSADSSAFFGYNETEVWATDGTSASTRKVWDGASDGTGRVHDLFAWGPGAAFWAFGDLDPARFVSFWRSDGTAGAATRLFDLPLEVGPPSSTTALGDELYFRAQSPVFQVWRSDGTSGGTRQLTSADSGEFLQDLEFTRVGGWVYFVGRHGIWRTDGTVAGTSLAIPGPLDDDPDGQDCLSWLHEQGGALLFQRTENGVHTIWRSLGTPATTQQIAALDVSNVAPRSAASVAGSLYFAADDGARGIELWRTDGSASGTVLVRDISPGPVSGNPHELIAADGRLLFAAEEPFHGSELWMSDGSAGGTRRVQDIAPLAASAAPADLTLAGDRLYFSADDAVTGRELWALPLAALPAPCATGETELCLGGGRFRIEVEWTDFAGNSGRGQATPQSADTGFFWFFDPSIVELIVKVIDGRDFNGHFWVYFGALSNVEYTVTITDTETDEVRTYFNPSGTFASVGDILAFPIGEATAGDADRVATAPRTAASPVAPTGTPGTCVPGIARLCLQDGRFALDVVWTDFAGNSGYARAVPLSADTGYFWFFSPSNIEVVAKVVDGRPFNGSFWVFYGALSNVEYTLTVTDTVWGLQRFYTNPSGHFASVGDIDPFRGGR